MSLMEWNRTNFTISSSNVIFISAPVMGDQRELITEQE